MTKKPNAKQMLELPPQKFWVEVSRAITPKPWRHRLEYLDGSVLPWHCIVCDSGWKGDRDNIEMPLKSTCIDPPPLIQATEVIVRQWRDKNIFSSAARICDVADILMPRDGFDDDVTADQWFAYYATPEQQMAAILVAMNLWEVE